MHNQGESGITEDASFHDTEVMQLLLILRTEEDAAARSAAFSAVYEKYKPLVRRMVYRFCGTSDASESDRYEMEQEAQIALYRAAMTYKEDRHTTFGFYAAVCIRNRLISCIRRKKQDAALAASELMYPVPDTSEDPGEQLVSRDMFRERYNRFLASLTVYEKKVYMLYIRGASYKKIAWQLHCTGKMGETPHEKEEHRARKSREWDQGASMEKAEKSVENAVYRIRVKLKQYMQL